MKYVAAGLLALTISSGTIANAGGLTDPVLEKDIIIEAAKAGSSSSAVLLVALTGLFMFAVAAQ